LSVAKILIK